MYRHRLIRKIIFAFLAQLAFPLVLAAEPIQPHELFPEDTYHSPKLSPDGSRIVVYVKNIKKGRLVIYNTNNFSTEGVIELKAKQFIWNFNWVSNNRIVFETAFKKPGSYDIQSYGEIFAVNRDGSKAELIFGFRAGNEKHSAKRTLRRGKTAQRAWGKVVHWLPEDQNHVLIEVEPWAKDSSANSSLFKLNVNTGRTDRITPRVPTDSTDFYLSKDGSVILTNGIKETEEVESFTHKLVDNKWVPYKAIPPNSTFKVLGYAKDKGDIYLLTNVDVNFSPAKRLDKVGLYTLNLNSGKQRLIYTHEQVDLEFPVYDETGEVTAIEFNDGYPSYVMMPEHNDAECVFAKFAQWFNGYSIRIVSHSFDSNKAIVFVSSDTMPGTYYLYDKQTQKPVQLFRKLKIKTARFTYTQPIQFKSFDNTLINGYLTSRNPQTPSPTVLLIHGGPILRDYADFSAEAQLLASHGYTVLQVNYRGSAGYGRHFEEAGYLHWGDHIQQDILAGLDWAVANKHTDKQRVCIMGSSFGAYSAMMSATIKPDAFKCVIANAGIYDLNTAYADSDIPSIFWGTNYLDHVLGKNEKLRQRFSPINYVDKITAAVFLAHGKTDERTPFVNAEQMLAALQKRRSAQMPLTETLFLENESHGFSSTNNQINYLEKVLTFLDKHLN